MKKEEFLEQIKTIGSLDSAEEIRTHLTELSASVEADYDEREQLREQVTGYQSDNEKLRQANMKLFLRVGADKTDEEIEKEKTGIEKEEEKEPRKFDDLFDEKGRLK